MIRETLKNKLICDVLINIIHVFMFIFVIQFLYKFTSVRHYHDQVHGQITVSYKISDVGSHCSIGWIMHTFKQAAMKYYKCIFLVVHYCHINHLIPISAV